jgi:ribosomal protein L14E/L6E/L27E
VINFGPDAGKLCTIVDIVDQNKCLVDGPRSLTGVSRQIMPFKRLALTDLVVKVERSARDAELTAAFKVTKHAGAEVKNWGAEGSLGCGVTWAAAADSRM